MSWEKEKRNWLNSQLTKDFYNLIFRTDLSMPTF